MKHFTAKLLDGEPVDLVPLKTGALRDGLKTLRAGLNSSNALLLREQSYVVPSPLKPQIERQIKAYRRAIAAVECALTHKAGR